MSTEITNQIANILQKRKATADEPKREKERLESLELRIRQLENLRQQLIHQPSNSSVLVEQLRQIDFSKLLALIVQEQEVWENLWKRFNRDTVNIGVAGLARQGKSTFLQKVAGLSDAEIPSSDRMPCTSVQSNIYHSKQDTYGLVHFHSQTSFLEEVILPYYQELGFSPPRNLAEFRNKPFPSAPTNPRQPAKADSVYRHLHDEYYDHFDGYARLLQQQKRAEIITKQQIKEYVSQEYDSEGNPLLFSHLAVQKVDIFCCFPKTDVEKVALVDMPGLGDTRLGDAERMIKALGQDVDFILFVRRPPAQGGFWGQSDVDLYDGAYQALKDKLPLEEWSFMVLNYDGQNGNGCQDLENTRVNKGIHVKKCLKANCNNPEAANNVLGEVLFYLANNIVRLDKQYMSACQSSLNALQIEVKAELEKARKALEQYGDSYAEYVNLRDQFVEGLYDSIEGLRHQLRQEPKQPDPDFKAQVDAAIEKCNQEPGIPKLEQIQSQINRKGFDGAYFWSIQQMRSNLLKHFHPLEVGLKESLDKKKYEIAEILIKLGLGGMTEKRGTEFLEALAQKLPAKSNSLKLGFQFLATFEFLYKGFIQSIVWRKISKNFPSDTNIPLATPDDINGILTHLQDHHQEAINNCQKALDGLALLIAEVGHSMVEEFADHITRGEGVEQEWDIFLGKFRTQVWIELQELEGRKQVEQEWMTIVDEAVSINQQLGS